MSGLEMQGGPAPYLFSATTLKIYSFFSMSFGTRYRHPRSVEVTELQPISSFELSFFSRE